MVEDGEVSVVKWEVAGENNVQDHAAGPDIRRRAIVASVFKNLPQFAERNPLPVRKRRPKKGCDHAPTGAIDYESQVPTSGAM